MRPTLEFEKRYKALNKTCIGVDEVGRGCLAGPVVTAAVMLPQWVFAEPLAEDRLWIHELNDSKKIPPIKRQKLAKLIRENAEISVAWCSSQEIDSIDILRAAMLAMRKASQDFKGKAEVVLVDGNQNPFEVRWGARKEESTDFEKVELIVKGDARCLSIAAASIVAKVYRDEWMQRLDLEYPGYHFSEHKGYSTALHQEALLKLGPCEIHRVSFSPVREALNRSLGTSFANPQSDAGFSK